MNKNEKKHVDKVRYIGTTRPRASSKGLYISVLIVCLVFGYAAGAAWSMGPVNDFDKNLIHVLSNPFPLRFNKDVAVVMTIFLGIGLFYVLMDWTKPKNFAHGYEFGEEKWADINELNERLRDDDANKNRILTEHVEISTDPDITDLNNNMLIIGGPGSRKSHGIIKPNILRMCGSMAITDPKGELLRTTGKYLKKHGYKIKVLNLISMKGNSYNPFLFIHSLDDIPKILTAFFENTKGSSGGSDSNPFWDRAEMMFDQAIMTYLYMEDDKPTFPRMVDMINKASVVTDPAGNKLESDLDRIFKRLRVNHPARVLYNKAMTGAADTVRSIIICAQARLNIFSNSRLIDMMSDNDIDFKVMGFEKTAFFMVIPDVDTTYNAIASMAYTQMIQELYAAADSLGDGDIPGRLPLPVTMWLDEFANVSMPSKFLSYLSTMRGRNISACMVIQGIAQLKDKYKDLWESVPTCCDTIIFLGGNGLETNKWVSEEIGKTTYDKATHGESFGAHGSSSRNYDVYGRELMTPSELRRMPRSMCVVIIAGEYPLYDNKYKTHLKNEFKDAIGLGPYRHEEAAASHGETQSSYVEIKGKELLDSLKGECKKLSDVEAATLQAYCRRQDIPYINLDSEEIGPDDREEERIMRTRFNSFSDSQYSYIRLSLLQGLDCDVVEKAIRPDYSAEKIKLILANELRLKNTN